MESAASLEKSWGSKLYGSLQFFFSFLFWEKDYFRINQRRNLSFFKIEAGTRVFYYWNKKELWLNWFI